MKPSSKFKDTRSGDTARSDLLDVSMSQARCNETCRTRPIGDFCSTHSMHRVPQLGGCISLRTEMKDTLHYSIIF